MGATASMMSGSGGTMFGIFSKKNILDAVRAQQEFGKRGWFSFICNLEKIEIQGYTSAKLKIGSFSMPKFNKRTSSQKKSDNNEEINKIEI